ncbi:MAG TPA: SPOR domain-containing protein [Blastocatellia bacterium]|nr:SPOR domain-containing protein [Blastocatellia bacterium]
MHSKLALIASALFFLLTPPALGQPAESIFSYTLQVASFPDAALAEQYAEHLSGAGETVGFGTYELTGRGRWTRVYVGSFKSTSDARRYGEALMGRGLIVEYLVKTARELQSLSRPHSVNPNAQADTSAVAAQNSAAAIALSKATTERPIDSRAAVSPLPKPLVLVLPRPYVNLPATRLPGQPPPMSEQLADLLIPLPDEFMKMPVAHFDASLVPTPDVQAIPRVDPIYLALNLINGSRSGQGGLWLSGDTEDALERLRYIVGDHAQLLTLGENGAVRLNHQLLAAAAGADQVPADEVALHIAEYVTDNEGLLLLVQLAEGGGRYLLHIGRRGPVLSGMIDVVGGVNLDNNYDSRINPYRRNGRKLDVERPPKGFDALVAINPVARWFNLRSNEFVSPGQITFHELAEAHAKVVSSLDYLEQDGRPGAHNVALEREERLKAQRPSANVVMTLGSNRLFRSEEEVRNFYAQTGSAGGNQH